MLPPKKSKIPLKQKIKYAKGLTPPLKKVEKVDLGIECVIGAIKEPSQRQVIRIFHRHG